MADHYELTIHFEVNEGDDESGLPKLRTLLAELPILASEVALANRIVIVTATCSADTDTDSIVDQIAEAITEVFPSESVPQPCEFDDPTFGNLAYCEKYSWYEGSFELPEETDLIGVYIDSESGVPIQASLDRARQIVEQWTERKSKLYSQIVTDLLDLYNKEWRKLDEKNVGPLSAVQFCDRLSLSSLAIDNVQMAKLRFYADGMFTEHGVTATISADDELESWVD